MKRYRAPRSFPRWRAAFAGLAFTGGALLTTSATANETPPNLVVVFVDDLGYADIGPFGCNAYATPNLDRMAAEGRAFTDFHSATAVCSASRAALMTGCYPPRVSVEGAYSPWNRNGLHPQEVTLAEVCKSRGYATACVGKWHLGDLPQFLPTRQGFDEWFGLPYSNDMWQYRDGETTLEHGVRSSGENRVWPPLPLYDGERVIDDNLTPKEHEELTARYTRRAVDFVDRHAGRRPFFLYMPHTMAHVPLFVSPRFAGKSGAGLYGDVLLELDDSVGQVMAALERGGVADDTLVIFTSDNGPWLCYGDHAGSAGPLREGKGTMFEGGYRVPCLMRWPRRIPAGTSCDELCSTMDLLPTVVALLGADSPPDRKVDGRDVTALLTGDARSPHDAFYCYYDGALLAVRDRRWKLVLPHRYRTLGDRPGGAGGRAVPYDQAEAVQSLYDLKNDLGETTDVSAANPAVVKRLLTHVEAARRELGDRLTGREGASRRPVGFVPKPERDR
ncbi:MAG: sulfatase family protein [Lacipirellulaceae bacterium]